MSLLVGNTWGEILFLVLVVGPLALFGVYAYKRRDRNLW